MKFIQISDLHFSHNPDDNHDIVVMLDFIQANYQDHYLIVTGDIVNGGLAKPEEEYKKARNALLPFRDKIFICPGNHDFGQGGTQYSDKRAKLFDSMLSLYFNPEATFSGIYSKPVVSEPESYNDNEKVVLIALDTNKQTKSNLDLGRGAVGTYQLEMLQGILIDTQYSDHTKILFFHHHPFIHELLANLALKLEDADKLENLLRTVDPKVDILCFGHKHKQNSWRNRIGVEYVLASGKSPEEKEAWEIDITNKAITINSVRIRP